MSKRMTKVLSLILTLVMFLSITPPAFAWGSGELGPGLDRDIGEDEVRDFELPEDFEEEEEPLDYFQTTNELNGSMVTVEAPMGSLPSLAELRAEPVAVDEIQAAVNSVLNTDANILVAMDISFWLNDVEIEPEEPVRVKISAPELDGKQNLTLVHIPDEAEPETVDLLDEDELSFALGTNEIAFQADSFSVYVIVDGEREETVTYRRTYKFTTDGETPFEFYDKAGKLVSEQIVKTGDTLEKVTLPYSAGHTFQDWVVHSSTDESIEVGTEVELPLEDVTVSQDATVVLKPAYGDVFYVTFHAKPIAPTPPETDVILTKKIVVKNEYVVVGDVVAPKVPNDDTGSYLFNGWTPNQNGSGNVTVVYNNGQIDYEKEYPYPINANLDLYPNYLKGHWLRFVAGEPGSGAWYVPGQFVLESDPALRTLPTTNRPGYKFDGWYKKGLVDESGEIEYLDQITNPSGNVINPSSGLKLTADLTLYAHWTPNSDSKYKVVLWRQSVSDHKNYTDEQKTYDFAEAVERTGTTDAMIPDTSEFTSKSGGDYLGFHYARTSQSSTTIKADGSTVINVYYDRDMMAFNFYYVDSNSTAYTYTVDNRNGTYGLKPDGTYVLLSFQDQDTYRVYYTYGTYNPLSNVSIDTGRTFNGTFYTRSGSIFNRDYNNSGYSSTNLPPENSTDIYFGRVSGTYRRLFRHTEVIQGGYYYYKDADDNKIIYTGDRYRRNTLNGHRMETYTGLWGQNFDKYGYTWPSERVWNEDVYGNGATQTFKNSFDQTTGTGSSEKLVNPYNLFDQGANNATQNRIFHYKQNLDGTYSNVAENVDYFPVKKSGTEGRFTFEDKFAGFKVSTYDENPTGFSAGGGNNPASGEQYVYYPLHVYHTRNTHDIIYMASTAQQPTVFSEVKRIENVYYEKKLGEIVDGELVSDYNLSLEAVGVPPREGYVFTGWFADRTCTKAFNFNSTMPDANVTLYAGFEPIWHLIKIDPDHGEITSDIGGTYTWKQFGTEEKLHRYEVERNYIEDPNGTYYYDARIYENVNEGYNGDRTATYVTEHNEYTAKDGNKKYREIDEEQEDGYTLVGWYDVDPETGETTNTPHNFDEEIRGDVWIRAVWVLGGNYGLYYDASMDVTVGGSTVKIRGEFTPSEPNARYADGAEIVLDNPPENPEGYVFDGWEVVEPRTPAGQGAVLAPNDGTYYQPGETLKLNAALWARYRTITLRAHYTPVDSSDQAINVTYLQFQPNFPTTAEPRTGVATDVTYYPLNTAIDLKVDAPKYTAAGFELVGWSQDKNAEPVVHAKDADGKIVVFSTKDVVGVDALTPTETLQYEGKEVAGNVLYAIWAPVYFYIYHSADNTVEKIKFNSLTDGKINLVEKVAQKSATLEVPCLYGGYFSDYGGKSEGFDVKKAAALTASADTAKDTGATPYTYDTIHAKLGDTANTTTKLWTYANGGKADGRTLVPEGNVIYYLKEVPNGYLNPYTQYTYYKANNQLGTLWTITAVDELNYKYVGFYITELNNPTQPAQLLKKIVFSAEHGKSGEEVPLTPASAFGAKSVQNGWLGWADVASFAETGDPAGLTYTIRMFWTTRDGVQVFGNTMRELKTGDGTVNAGTGLTATDKDFVALSVAENP